MYRACQSAIRILAATCLVVLFGCNRPSGEPGKVLDEAKRAGRDAASFPAADEDYFHDMDGGIKLSPAEVKGRNTWSVWTGGNDRFWNGITASSAGALDFLKTLSSNPAIKCPSWFRGGNCVIDRDIRWEYLGLVNEPCFEKATGPDPDRYGLWLDKRIVGLGCPPDPFENVDKYPGVAIDARTKLDKNKRGSFYGWASGIVGLRLFPNPDFDDAAAKKWDANRYYTDPSYYNSRDLVKPYRVGMSCAFCHVGPNPVNPPADADHPKWENLSSNVGAQYFWIDRIFDWNGDASSYVYQMFHASKPGSLDTSLVSTDNIDNPRTMNAIYYLKPRLDRALLAGKETLAGGSLNNRQFNEFVKPDDPQLGWLTKFFQAPDTVWSPRVLKDGSDSVGGLGALNRVYLNIGLFSEEWLLHFNALVGGKRTTPIKIADARKNSTYWLATEAQTVDMALFFLKSTDPHKLKDAPGGDKYKPEQTKLAQGKKIFADYCARCHSSKMPPIPSTVRDPGVCSGTHYMECWDSYWQWTKTADFQSQMEKIVAKDDFLTDNFLSSEFRVPVTLLQTNACSPLATNAIRDNIWDNFSSETYKNLPSVGSITWYHPVTGKPNSMAAPGGGRGFTRPASLVSLWSTAPFLLNNSVGAFHEEPSVDERMKSFDDSIEQMLWPEKRVHDPVIGDKMPLASNGLPLPSEIARTTQMSYLRVATGYLPDFLQGLAGPVGRWFPSLLPNGNIEIGPIPKGTPVNLIASLDILGPETDLAGRAEHGKKVLELLLKIQHDLKAIGSGTPEELDRRAAQVLSNVVDPLLALSKCPDYIVNRGHYFGTSYLDEEKDRALTDDQKRALIEYLKTF
ncbi:MAG TPA: hypothetical protein VMH80_28920 [Bryobacteraceae bacterium]|nr:hypothetical protein [Bryobacteraceae bacterium]